MRKKKTTRYIKKRRWVALYKITKRRFFECLGDHFPVFAVR